MKPRYEVSDILQIHSSQLSNLRLNSWQSRTLQAIADCRTQALGGHVDLCNHHDCRHIHISYNSCRNRHCPKCQGHKQDEWIVKREKELLNTPYFHVVFTLPDVLNQICLFDPKTIYSILFKTAWSVVSSFAGNPKLIGAKTGMIAVLHTWGQNLSLHPHLHCIVPGGGITKANRWKKAKGKDKYLFPVKAMSKVFRARFVEYLRKELVLESSLYKALFKKSWVVYCKRPFFGPKQVIEYLGRYTHKIAISNHRIKSIADHKVTFTAKDYRHGERKYLCALSHQEFIRRFALHILPKAFVRIRHYGILSSVSKKIVIPLIQQQLGKTQLPDLKPKIHRLCYKCRKGILVTLYTFKGRAPPVEKVLQEVKKRFPKLLID